jgi:hypothetical protein
MIASGLAVDVGDGVNVFDGVSVDVGVRVFDGVNVSVGVKLGVRVFDGVNVFDGVSVLVGDFVGLGVRVNVGDEYVKVIAFVVMFLVMPDSDEISELLIVYVDAVLLPISTSSRQLVSASMLIPVTVTVAPVAVAVPLQFE